MNSAHTWHIWNQHTLHINSANMSHMETQLEYLFVVQQMKEGEVPSWGSCLLQYFLPQLFASPPPPHASQAPIEWAARERKNRYTAARTRCKTWLCVFCFVHCSAFCCSFSLLCLSCTLNELSQQELHASNAHTHTHLLTHSITHSLTHSLTHTHMHIHSTKDKIWTSAAFLYLCLPRSPHKLGLIELLASTRCTQLQDKV
jgi:hypothetical protein